MNSFTVWVCLFSATAFFVCGGYTVIPPATLAVAQSYVDPRCTIKGNISFYSREKIYHVPGQEHYTETIIRPEDGERWFCSEGDARTAGWRKAGR